MYPDSLSADPCQTLQNREAMSEPAAVPAESRVRVLVIGAGQAGLSTVWYLLRGGLSMGTDVLVVDRAPAAGGAWQFRWQALRLGTAHRVDDLPGMAEMGLRFAEADQTRPARDVVSEYYRRWEAHHRIPVERPVAVVSVRDDGRDLVAVLRHEDGSTRTVRSEVVVTATGTWGAPFVPWYPGRDTFRGRQIDTTQYRSAAEFRGQDVVVVGGGTSAIGFLLELDGVARSTTWCTRRPVAWAEGRAGLGLQAAVAAVAEQDAAARAGRSLPSIVSGTGVPVSRRIRAGIDRGVLRPWPMFTSIETDGVRMTDGSFRHADAIIWATGFRPELRHLRLLGLRTANGGPAVVDGMSQQDGRVFFAGYGPQASTIGASRAGRRIARQVLARLASD